MQTFRWRCPTARRVAVLSRQVSMLPRHIQGTPGCWQPVLHTLAVPPCDHPSHLSRQLTAGRVKAAASASEQPQVKPYVPPAGGFRVHRITGDGSCLFRAICCALHWSAHSKPLGAAAEATAALNLRAAVIKEMRGRRSELEPFLAGIADDFDEYLERMSHPAAWGGEPEMLMASDVVRRPITVYRPVGGAVEPIVTYGEPLLSAGVAPVNLLWSGAHYDLLIPATAAGAA